MTAQLQKKLALAAIAVAVGLTFATPSFADEHHPMHHHGHHHGHHHHGHHHHHHDKK